MLEKIKQWLKSLGLTVTDEQLQELEIEEVSKENKEDDTKEETQKTIKGGEDEKLEDKLLERIAALEAKLQEQEAKKAIETKTSKIKELAKDTLDIDYLMTLLKDVEEKDLKVSIDKVKSEKPYLFKSVETKGFNPAGEVETMTGVEKSFFERNPDLKSN